MNMSAMLNDDCWRAILSLFKYDFRTLSRLMRVSQRFLNLAAPVLYSRLGHPQSKNLIESWSINKRKKLSTLLLTSSGFLDTTSTTSEAPPFVDYFGLLTWMPKHMFETRVWHDLMEADDKKTEHTDIYQNYNRSTSTARHATVLTEIRIDELAQIEKWSPHAEKFAKLEVLVVNFGKPYPNGVMEKILGFVNRHSAVFPGQLKEICSGNESREQMAMELNMSRKNPERLQLRLGDEFMEFFQRHGYNNGYNIVDREKSNDLILTMLFKSIKILLIKDTRNHVSASVYSLFSRALQHCRQMEEIALSTYQMSQKGRELEGIFAWAPKEFEQTPTAHATLGVDQDHQLARPLQQLATKDVGITSLVPLKSFKGYDVPESVLMDVMNGFRYSLEQIEFSSCSRNRAPVGVDWTWLLPNLKILKLFECYLAFCKLEEFCPNLEELWLSDVMSLESNSDLFQGNHRMNNIHFGLNQEESGLVKKYWRPTRSLKVMRFSLTSDSSTLELDSIANLHRLEDLSFGRFRWQEADGRNLFRQLGCVQLLHWDLSKLRRLTLIDFDPDWSRLLLRSAPNLEYFSAPANVMFPECDGGGFWMETRLDTLSRVAEFEARVNKWNEPGNEYLLERQKEKLYRERLLDTYRTLEEDEIWNAHLAKLRLMVFNRGFWSKSGFKKLKSMFDSSHGVHTETVSNKSDSNHRKNNESNDVNSQDNHNRRDGNHNRRDGNHNPLGIYDHICFPYLRHVIFNGSIDGIKREEMDELVKSAMQHPGMIRVEAYFSQLTTAFLESLQALDNDNFPKTRETEFCSEVEDAIGYDGPCVLIALGSNARYYYLNSNDLSEHEE